MNALVTPRDALRWDWRNWARALDFWLQQSQRPTIDRILEVGAGRGMLSLWLTQFGRVISSDLRPRHTARTLHAAYGDVPITYCQASATALPFRDLDVICFRSVLGALNSPTLQAKAIHEMWAALKPGGEVWFAENLAGSWLHRCARRYGVRWARTWCWVTAEEMRAFFRPFTVDYLTWGILATFGRREWQRTMLAGVDGWLSPRLPARWHYIIAGVARKET